jgi:S1-C subfamily serine protease
LRSAAAALLIAAAAFAGAGIGHAVWAKSQPVSSAAGATAPSSPGGTSGSGGGDNGGSLPGFGTLPGGSSTLPSGSGGTTTEGAGAPSDVSAIAAKVDPAIVDVNVSFTYQDAVGAGTGIVLTSSGEVLTNNHVIDGATKISVTDIGNGKTYSATVVGYDNTHDVAILQLQGASGLATAKLATAKPSVGEAVVAIGNAGGAGGTPTSAGGSITALGQSISASDELTGSSEQLANLIQVNANVESGDSGGPLVNASGQVVGMDTAASSGFAFSSQGNAGFAIPISSAIAIADDAEAGHATATLHLGATAFLGVLVDASPSQSYYGQLGQAPSVTGVSISNVVNGAPAQVAGITAGDTIESLDGHAVSSPSQLTQLLVPHHPGQKVTIVWADETGATHTATVTLTSGPPA